MSESRSGGADYTQLFALAWHRMFALLRSLEDHIFHTEVKDAYCALQGLGEESTKFQKATGTDTIIS